MQVAANLSLLWGDLPFAERFERAARAGFSAVELWWPGDEDARMLPELTRANGLQLAALNFDAGDMAAGDRGLLADPAASERYREHVPLALSLASECGCRRMNTLIGLRLEEYPVEHQLATAHAQLLWTAERAADHGVTVLVEAVNSYENGPYLVPTTEEADALVRLCDTEHVRLLYDVYHRARMGANVFRGLEQHRDVIAHVQVADCPGRNEPGTGDVDFTQVFAELGAFYDAYVGLEYRPSAVGTDASLAWFREAGLLVGAEA